MGLSKVKGMDKKMKKSALVLMATYNGENYVSQQLESIISQDYSDFDLYIRDDGSTDKTLEIIKSYIKEDNRILLIENQGNVHGACINFYELLKIAKKNIDNYKYYFLSDQDDIWQKNKLSREIEEIRRVSVDNTPSLVYSDLMIMDEKGNNQLKMSELQNINLTNPADIFFNQIYVWGNTIAINKELLKMIQIPLTINNGISHDHYLAFYAAAFGNIKFIDVPLVRYRRYETNVSDLPHKYSKMDAAKKALKKMNSIVSSHAANYNNILYFIYNAPLQNQLTKDIELCYKIGGIKALRIMKKYHVSGGANKYNKIAKKMILFSKIYKFNNNYHGGKFE